MSINLYVDDLRNIPDGFIGARTYEEAVSYLSSQTVNIISLDHDLGSYPDGTIRKTGYDLVKWICENGISIEKIFIHTDNPVGRENMYETLKAARKRNFISPDTLIYHYGIVPNKMD